VSIFQFRIVRVEPRPATQHGLDLIGEVAFCELAPDRYIEQSLRGAQLFAQQVIVQTRCSVRKGSSVESKKPSGPGTGSTTI
jgi:hypothetical protein